MKKIFLLVLLLYLSFFSFSQKPKYIFLFIGDGMGLVQTHVANEYTNKVSNDLLQYMYFPHVGLQRNYSLSSQITCSAAAATAIACGNKTLAGYIGLNEKNDTLQSIASYAKNRGFKVGILTSVSIDHATPAAFYAHDNSRNSYHSIALQLPESGFDFFGGGAFIEPNGTINAYDKLKKYGYSLIQNPDSLQFISEFTNKKICVFDPDKELPYAIDAKSNEFDLSELTQAAINHLDNPNGFFMMVEGGKIDWACHSNDAATAIHEVIAFNKAINQAIEFYKLHSDETIIIVTSDHETGGMAYGSALYPYYTNISLLKNQTKSYVELESILAKKFSASTLKFEECMEILAENYCINKPNGVTLTTYDSSRLHNAYDFIVGKNNSATEDIKLQYNISTNSAGYAPQNKCMAIITTMNSIIAEKAGIGWTTFAHTGTPIPVYTIGVQSEIFEGIYDNTDIQVKISRLIYGK